MTQEITNKALQLANINAQASLAANSLYMNSLSAMADGLALRTKRRREHEDAYHLGMVVCVILSPIIVGLFGMVMLQIWDSWWMETQE